MSDDPRLNNDYLRTLPPRDSDITVTLVGVVHDYPASIYRVRRLVEAHDPAVLALELPLLAIPLYREYARDEGFPPSLGGETSTAVQAASTDQASELTVRRSDSSGPC